MIDTLGMIGPLAPKAYPITHAITLGFNSVLPLVRRYAVGVCPELTSPTELPPVDGQVLAAAMAPELLELEPLLELLPPLELLLAALLRTPSEPHAARRTREIAATIQQYSANRLGIAVC